MSLPEQVALAKRMFPRKKGHARWNLCISHAKRKTLNKICYDAEAKGERLIVRLADELVNEVFIGCKLVGNTTTKGIVNGVFYEVKSFTENHVQVKDLESDEELNVHTDHMRYMRLGWAMCYFTVQGRTLKAHTRLWDTDHKNYTVCILAMSVGRVCKPTDLDIA